MERRRKLHVLVVEDSKDDYDILVWHLRRLDFNIQALRVETAQAMREALARETWDIIVSDWSLPAFSAQAALDILHRSRLDVPFIIVSGTVGEETAVAALRNGAHDFLVKNRLARLGAIVQRELHDADVRRERARVQEELVISDSMATVRILTAGVAHEINNPLSAVLTNLELALDGLEDNSGAQRELLREEICDARDAAEHVRTIAHDLRVFSHSDQQPSGRVNVTRVLDSTLRLASNEISQRARLVKDYHPVPPVMASEARLGQAFLNLVVNALRTLPETTAANEMRATIKFTSGCVCVDLADNGPGIAPEAIGRLFTPFATKEPVGTGVGLSISHRIVTAMGGEVRVASEPSAGTHFTVLLPPAP